MRAARGTTATAGEDDRGNGGAAHPSPASRHENTVLPTGPVQSCVVSSPEPDRRLLVLLRTRGHPRALERVLAVYSRLGEHAACWIALGGVGGVPSIRPAPPRWRRGVRIVAARTRANYAVKLAVRRRRPELPGPAAADADGLAPVVPERARDDVVRGRARVPRAGCRRAALYAAAVAFAVSRPYLGVHYPSDVLAGARRSGPLVAERVAR